MSWREPFRHGDVIYDEPDGLIIHGDCRDILPKFSALETVITDPVWPDAEVKIEGHGKAYELFDEMCQAMPAADRLVIQLGCDSDPRFLSKIAARWNFLRVCWLDYARPSYKGRLLYTGDVAYAYGTPPAFIPGRQVMSGKCTSTKSDKLFERHTASNVHKRMFTGRHDKEYELPHPCPRRLQHVEFLVRNFSDEFVCDPFLGSGTTAVAAVQLNRRFVGIEISKEYAQLAADRVRAAKQGMKLTEYRQGQGGLF